MGTVLDGKFVVGNLLGSPGGFGIAYLGWDRVLQRKVVIKELFPDGLVTRAAGSTKAVDPVQSTHRAFFNLQRELFLDEARKLARLDGVDAVARVIHYFAENDTAYFVMPHVPGTSIAARVAHDGPLRPGAGGVDGAGGTGRASHSSASAPSAAAAPAHHSGSCQRVGTGPGGAGDAAAGDRAAADAGSIAGPYTARLTPPASGAWPGRGTCSITAVVLSWSGRSRASAACSSRSQASCALPCSRRQICSSSSACVSPSEHSSTRAPGRSGPSVDLLASPPAVPARPASSRPAP